MEGIEQHVLQTHFGAFLKMHRDQWSVRQREVLFYLPGWTQANYSRLESGVIAPSFDQLLPIYRALLQAGVHWNAADRRQFFTLARTRLEGKKNRPDYHPDSEWEELRYQVADLDFFPDEPAGSTTPWTPPRPLLAETRHLVGREDWHAALIGAVQSSAPKKLLVLQGPVGIGKSSELHRLIQHFIHAADPAYHIIWVPLLPPERGAGPESSLDIVLGNILAERGSPALAPEQASWEQRQRLALTLLGQSDRPVMILVDNAESALTEGGILAACWEEFLVHFLRYQHKATLILATKEWPGWSGRDRAFVYETNVPPLDTATSILLLQQQGLEAVSVEQLQEVSTRVGGIPLYLEWVASLVQNPHQLSQWQSFDVVGEQDGRVETGGKEEEEIARRLTHLLAEPTLLRGHLANKLRPLLERLVDRRLSAEARSLLQHLAVCNVPLGKTALQTLCEHPGPINELRNASLLVAYAHRVQVLPIVASVVVQRLTAERVGELEERVIRALKRWKDEGSINDNEAGSLVTELVRLLIKHYRLLNAARLLLSYHPLISNSGQATRLARFNQEVMNAFDWRASPGSECGGLLLHYTLAPFLGKSIDVKEQVTAYRHILDSASAGRVKLRPSIEAYIIGSLVESAINDLCFEEAHALFEVFSTRLESLHSTNEVISAYLLEQRAWVLGVWSDYVEEHGEKLLTQTLRKQAISLYRQSMLSLRAHETLSSLQVHHLKTQLSSCSNDLAYYLARDGKFEEGLQIIEQGIELKEQGYLGFGTLASAYGEKSEILMELGQYQEALFFDEKALAEAQRLANMGHPPSQDEVWMYLANRGRLYLRLGRIDEAEQLLREALPRIHTRRSIYRMFARDALDEIEQWRKTNAPYYQFDWRWVERYRRLCAYDTYWWWAQAGPFNDEEQRQWDQLAAQELNKTTKEALGVLIATSRERELQTALDTQREPHLCYPALNIKEVHIRLADLLQLDSEINQYEPNAIVRRLYHDAIDEEVLSLRLIESTYQGNNTRFWELMRGLIPEPTREEMEYALSHLAIMLKRGQMHAETMEVSEGLLQFVREQFLLSFDLSARELKPQQAQNNAVPPSSQRKQKISPQAAKRFLETLLNEYGYENWQVSIDPNAQGPRIEQGLRQIFLTDSPESVDTIRYYVSHELAGHVSRCIAGERSKLGLLGIHTKNSLETEEGLAVYYDRQGEMQRGQIYNDMATWLEALVVGLASGTLAPPQTFLALYKFLEDCYLLYQLLRRPSANKGKARKRASKYALSMCLRAFLGVPNLEQAGVCMTKDVLYLRGLWKIERAVAQDETVLDRLAAGVVALEQIPDLQELGIGVFPQPLRKLASDPDLDTYIVSFEAE